MVPVPVIGLGVTTRSGEAEVMLTEPPPVPQAPQVPSPWKQVDEVAPVPPFNWLTAMLPERSEKAGCASTGTPSVVIEVRNWWETAAADLTPPRVEEVGLG